MDNYGNIIHQSLHNYFNTLEKVGYVNDVKTSQLLVLTFIYNFLQEYSEYITEDDYRLIQSIIDCMIQTNCLVPYDKYKSCYGTARRFYSSNTQTKDIYAEDVILKGDYPTVQDWYNNTRPFVMSTLQGSNIELTKYEGCLIHLGTSNTLKYNYSIINGSNVPEVKVTNPTITIADAIYYNGEYYVDNVKDQPCIIEVTDTNPYTKRQITNTYTYHIMTKVKQLPQVPAYYAISNVPVTEYSLPSNVLEHTTTIPFGDNYVYAYFYIPSNNVTAKIISGNMESEMTLIKVGEVKIGYPVMEVIDGIKYPNPIPTVTYSVFTLPDNNRVKDTLTIKIEY